MNYKARCAELEAENARLRAELAQTRETAAMSGLIGGIIGALGSAVVTQRYGAEPVLAGANLCLKAVAEYAEKQSEKVKP